MPPPEVSPRKNETPARNLILRLRFGIFKEGNTMNKRYASRLTVLTLAAFAVFSPLSALAGETTARDSIMATLQNHPKLKAFQENREASTQDLKRARAG